MKLTIHEFAQLMRTSYTGACSFIRSLDIEPIEPGRRGRGHKMIIDLADIAARLGCTEMELLTYIRVNSAIKDKLEKRRGEKRS